MKRKKFLILVDSVVCAIDMSREGDGFSCIVRSGGYFVVENFGSPLRDDEELIATYEDGRLISGNPFNL